MLLSHDRGLETIGAYRRHDDAMQIVSGRIDRPTVHFEAPPSAQVQGEMDVFVDWFNRTAPEGSTPLPALTRAALGHLWFESIHPFEDGNGRMARAIADMSLARADGGRQRFYSMTSQIEAERKAYYGRLEAQQRGDLNITPWLTWFLDCLGRAFDRADETLASVLYKARLWDEASRQPLNERQRLVIGRMLGDWEGCMTTSKYARLARCSGDTALRDMRELIAGGVFVQNPGGGRSTSYRLASGEELGAA